MVERVVSTVDQLQQLDLGLIALFSNTVCCGLSLHLTGALEILWGRPGSHRRMLRGLVSLAIILGVVCLAALGIRPAGDFIPSVLLIFSALSAGWLLLRAGSRTLWRIGARQERVLIMGTGPQATKIAREIRSVAGYTVIGFVREEGTARARSAEEPALPESPPILGSVGELRKLIRAHRPDRIIVALAERRKGLPLDDLLEARLEGIRVEHEHHASERILGKFPIEILTPGCLVFSDHFRASRFHLGVRRATSFLAASIGFVLTAPLFLPIALAVRLTSKGSVFFLHERMGLR
ncbi:MAG: hypothetical protein ACREQY_00225, partial [Candidatus Binatia bacterium]